MSSRMYLTDTDHIMLRHIEEFKSITIKQCQKIFYNTQNYGYDIARKRLKKMSNYGKVKVARDSVTNQNVYYLDKKLSYHDILLMDYYAELISSGVKIIRFDIKKEWMNGQIISDGFCAYSLGNNIYYNIIEVNVTHFPINEEKDKYNKLFESKEAHYECDMIYKKIGGDSSFVFPRFILIDDMTHRNEFKINDEIEVYQLDHKLNEFNKIFLD